MDDPAGWCNDVIMETLYGPAGGEDGLHRFSRELGGFLGLIGDQLHPLREVPIWTWPNGHREA